MSNPFDAVAAAPREKHEDAKIEGTRVHVTEVDRWLECGHRAQQYRTQRWQEPARPEAARGRAVHAAREFALKAFRKTGTLPPPSECEERADASVHEDTKVAAEIADDALLAEIENVAAEARLYARADRLGVLPDLAPHVVEVETTIEQEIGGDGLDGKYVLTGRPDAVARSPITGRLEVPDLKTSKVAPSVASVNASTQHSLYSALVQAKFGEPCGHSIQHVRILKTKPRSALGPNQRLVTFGGDEGSAVVTHVATDRTAEDVGAALRRLRFVLDAREQGFFPPAAAGFQSPCFRCPHRGHPDRQMRCEYVPATRAGEASEAPDA